jgi:hypothetical protein
MKPKPLVALKNLTVPLIMKVSFRVARSETDIRACFQPATRGSDLERSQKNQEMILCQLAGAGKANDRLKTYSAI